MESRKNLWLMSDTELTEYHKAATARKQIEEELPENKARLLRNKQMNNLLSDMIYPPLTLPENSENNSVNVPNTTIRSAKYSMGTKRVLLDEDRQRYELESQKQLQLATRLHFALERIAKTKWGSSHQAEGQLLNDIQHRDMLEKRITAALNSCSWPYKVGASLYLFQQMHDKNLTSAPSLNKAQWLLCNCSLDSHSPLTVRREDPRKIGEQWKTYYSVSDYWAAYAVWANSPMKFDSKKFMEFYYHCDYVKFKRLARFFRDFRARVKVQKGRVPYLKLGSAKWSAEESLPLANIDEIPGILSENQWAELKAYRL